MSYSIDDSKSEVLTILRDNCSNNLEKKHTIDDNFDNKINAYGTNILNDNTSKSVRNCDIRDDRSVNIENPINTNKEYEEILLDILIAEYESKIGDLDPQTLKILKLSISLYNKASVLDKEDESEKYKFNPEKKAIVSDKFLLKRIVRNSDGSLDIDDSAKQSIKNLICILLDKTEPFNISDSLEKLNRIIDLVISGSIKNYKYYNQRKDIVCLKDDIIEKAKLIKSIINSNIESEFINLSIFRHKFNNLSLISRDKFYYLTNIGDGDCLYIAIAKFLYILNHSSRKYPDNIKLRLIAEHIRLESCKYMFQNRYKFIDQRGSIEDIVGNKSQWSDELKNEIEDFSKGLQEFTINNFNNPTNIMFSELKDTYNTLDDFTKYCIYMAQHNNKLSPNAGEAEIICISELYKRNILLLGNATDGTKEGDNKKLTHYKVIGGNSIVTDSKDLPIFLFLKNSKIGGSHYELLWPKKFGEPEKKENNEILEYAEDDESRWEDKVSNPFLENKENSEKIELNKTSIIDLYIDSASPMIIQLLPNSINNIDNPNRDLYDVNIEKALGEEIIPISKEEGIKNITDHENITEQKINSNTEKISEDLDEKSEVISKKSIKSQSKVSDIDKESEKSIKIVKIEKPVEKSLLERIVDKHPYENYTKIGGYKYKNKYLLKIGSKLLGINGVDMAVIKLNNIDISRPINIINDNGRYIIQNFDSMESNDIQLLNILIETYIIVPETSIQINRTKIRRKRRRKKEN